MKCTAIIMVRNGGLYVDHCLKYLLNQNIDVALIDHGSVDDTYKKALAYKKHGLCLLKKITYDGYFSLTDQLKLKYELLSLIDSDWVIHQDIDEVLHSSYQYSLLEAINRADEDGYNVVNFDEMVFLPYGQKSFYQSKYYYYFSPFFPRLMRVWKKNTHLSALNSGGHVFEGNVKLSPDNGVLRHYIFTSQEHALEKYEKRIFLQNELNKGWHNNRINIALDALKFPAKSKLSCLSDSSSLDFDYSNPFKKHYWQWAHEVKNV